MDDKFKLNKSNIILLVMNIIIFILVIIFSELLGISLKDENGLPELVVKNYRTSTKVSQTTTTTTTITTTTTEVIKNSPYYSVDVDDLLTNELYIKESLTKDEATTIVTELYNTLDKIYNTSDNSLLDIQNTITYAKDGEIDKITSDGISYGIIYNGLDLFNKIFTKENVEQNRIISKKYENNKIIIKSDDNYYRFSTDREVKLTIVGISIDSLSTKEVQATINLYRSDYEYLGYTSPLYKKYDIKLAYESGRWKVSEFTYPLFD